MEGRRAAAEETTASPGTTEAQRLIRGHTSFFMFYPQTQPDDECIRSLLNVSFTVLTRPHETGPQSLSLCGMGTAHLREGEPAFYVYEMTNI